MGEAKKYLLAAYEGDKENPDIMTYLGEVFLAEQNFEEAFKWYKLGADKKMEKTAPGEGGETLFFMLEKTADLARPSGY